LLEGNKEELLMKRPDGIAMFYIMLDGAPYQGEHESVESSPPRPSQHSPVTRNRIKIGHPLDTPLWIQGHINLRSHVDRILTRMREGQRITTIEIISK
jgi:hypothetical protein